MEFERRKLPKSAGASIIPTAVSISNQAVAQTSDGDSEEQYPSKYSNTASVKEIINEHAEDFLKELAQKEVIPEKNTSLEIEEVLDYDGYLENEDATHVSMVKSDGVVSPVIHVRRFFGDDKRKVLINILPEESEVYALEYPSDDSDNANPTVYEYGDDGKVIKNGPCATSDVCRARINQCKMFEIYCCGGEDCGWGDAVDRICTGYCYASCGQIC